MKKTSFSIENPAIHAWQRESVKSDDVTPKLHPACVDREDDPSNEDLKSEHESSMASFIPKIRSWSTGKISTVSLR